MNIDPTREQFEALKNLPRDKPLNMLNLIRLRPSANYEDGRAATGAEAYTTYGQESGPIFAGVGGEIIWRGNPKTTFIGPRDEDWDIAFIARYPNLDAFITMIKDPAYQAIVFHRQAAVADSRLITHHEAATDGTFS